MRQLTSMQSWALRYPPLPSTTKNTLGCHPQWRNSVATPQNMDTRPDRHDSFHPTSWRPLCFRRVAWHKWLFGLQSRQGYAQGER